MKDLIISLLTNFYSGSILERETDTKQLEAVKESSEYKSYSLKFIRLTEKLKLGLATLKSMNISKNEKAFHEVNIALKALIDMKDQNTLDELVYDSIIRKCFYSKWDKSLTNSFEKVKKIIIDSKDYFISYTNRGARSTNTMFQDLISAYCDIEDREKNYLAKAIVYELNHKYDLKGFYDADKLQCGDEVQEVIYQGCTNALSFIQLIGQEIWSLREPNWCYNEFIKYKEKCNQDKIKNKEVYILEDQFALKTLNPPYREWFERVNEIKYHILISNKSEISKPNFNLHMLYRFRGIMLDIADKIKQHKEKILKELISSENIKSYNG